MRASCGCLVEDGMILHGFDGPCLDEVSAMPPRPSDEDYCAEQGHAYAGDDAGRGRCYCGTVTFPIGGAASPDTPETRP